MIARHHDTGGQASLYNPAYPIAPITGGQRTLIDTACEPTKPETDDERTRRLYPARHTMELPRA